MKELESLNPSQKEAVLLNDGPMMVLAGAGSGKTKTLVVKIHYLLEEENLSPHEVLALTFSNKAAREMRERIALNISFDIGALNVTTFHSFCARLLRSEAHYLGLSRNFTIYDDGEMLSVIKSVMGKRGMNIKETSPQMVKHYISDLKNQGFYVGADKLQDTYGRDQLDFSDDEFYHLFLDYEAELARSNAVDFGGLIIGVIKLLESYPEVLERYQNRFKYILVDEYQDTNRAQFILLNLLAKAHRNICVVGDEDQSIYSWRGADINNILDFEKKFKESKLIKLEQNYRSSKIIIEAAGAVIAQNTHRKGKTMWTDNTVGEKVKLVECRDDRSEAEYIARKIQEKKHEGVHYNDMAVFYRNNAQSRQIEDYLRQGRIPYRVVAGIKFYERKEIKDILCYIRLVVNPQDALALSRIINIPTRGVGVGTLRKLEQFAVEKNISLWEGIKELVTLEGAWPMRATSKVKNSLKHFVEVIEQVQHFDREKEKPSVSYKKLLEDTGYMEVLRQDKSREAQGRVENLEELHTAIIQYEEDNPRGGLVGFLETIILDSEKEESDSEGLVSLMTIHGAKGLEYDLVFVTGNEENIFPSYMSIEDGPLQVEEERRLFYVAMTRAMVELHITYALGRMLWGQVKFNPPSRFIKEIPEKYLEKKKFPQGQRTGEKYFTGENSHRKNRQYQDEDRYIELDDDMPLDDEPTYYQDTGSIFTYQKGEAIVHQLYGRGVVMASEGSGRDEKVTILFPGGVKKKFVIKYAPLSKG